MSKTTILSVLAAGVFATGSAYAGGKACCATDAANASSISFAQLNLSAEQKTKLTALRDKCDKQGCTKESHAQFLKQAKTFLSADQFAQLKAECDKADRAPKA